MCVVLSQTVSGRKGGIFTNRLLVVHTGLPLTSHRAESKLLIGIVVLGGATPFHVVPPTLRSTVSVIAVVVQEGEVAQSTIGISASSLNQNCPRQHRNRQITAELWCV